MFDNKYDLFEMYDKAIRILAKQRNIKKIQTSCYKGAYCVTIDGIKGNYTIEIEYLLNNLTIDYDYEVFVFNKWLSDKLRCKSTKIA